MFIPFLGRKLCKKKGNLFPESGTSGCKSKSEIVRVIANTIFPLNKISNRILF